MNQRIKEISIVLLRNDLRLHDNPLLHVAGPALVLYCLDPRQLDLSLLLPRPSTHSWKGPFNKCGKFRLRFLIESLKDVYQSLQSRLLVVDGTPAETIQSLRSYFNSTSIKIQKIITSKEISTEELAVENELKMLGIPIEFHWTSTLIHVDDLPFTNMQSFPDVFTTFRNKVEAKLVIREQAQLPKKLPDSPNLNECDLPFSKLYQLASKDTNESLYQRLYKVLDGMDLDALCTPDTRSGIVFKGGETAALKRLNHFIWDAHIIDTYKETRNGLIGMDYSSKLSPYLSLGCLSPRTLYWEIKKYEQVMTKNESTYWMIFELLTRDFFKFGGVKYGPGIFYLNGPTQLLKKNHVSNRSWKRDAAYFEKWKNGQTGIPWVDAAMRELNSTGFMSNRSRQNVASFLVHSMGFDWRWGASYFETLLIDHDVQVNYGNWQYVAGVGTDPRGIRKFNMMKQAQDYDPKAEFMKLWIPELNECSDPFMPWKSYRKPRSYPDPILIENAWKKR